MDARTAARLKKTVLRSEQNRGRESIDSRRYQPPPTGWILVVLQEDLRNDAPADAKRLYARNNNDADLTMLVDPHLVYKIYPWGLGDGDYMEGGWEVWCAPYCGRWYGIVPSQCVKNDND